MNVDGKLDLLVARSTPTRFNILLGDGTGASSPYHQFSAGTSTSRTSCVKVADMNRDRKGDIVLTPGSVLLNQLP